MWDVVESGRDAAGSEVALPALSGHFAHAVVTDAGAVGCDCQNPNACYKRHP
jgi:hypothetical protein